MNVVAANCQPRRSLTLGFKLLIFRFAAFVMLQKPLSYRVIARSRFVDPFKTSAVYLHAVKVMSVCVNTLVEPVQIFICSLPGMNSSMCCLLWFVSLSTILSQI